MNDMTADQRKITALRKSIIAEERVIGAMRPSSTLGDGGVRKILESVLAGHVAQLDELETKLITNRLAKLTDDLVTLTDRLVDARRRQGLARVATKEYDVIKTEILLLETNIEYYITTADRLKDMLGEPV